MRFQTRISIRIIYIRVIPTMPSSKIAHTASTCTYICAWVHVLYLSHHWWSWVFFIVTINNTVFSKLPISVKENMCGFAFIYIIKIVCSNSHQSYCWLFSYFQTSVFFFLLSFSVRKVANLSVTSAERFVTSITWRYSFSRRCWRYSRQIWTKNKIK